MKMRKKIILSLFDSIFDWRRQRAKRGKVVDRWKFLIRARMKVSWGFSVKESVTNGGTGNGTGGLPLQRVRFSHRRARVSFHLTFRKERDR